MSFLISIARLIEGISEYSGRTVSWLTSILVVLIGYDVAMRYIFNRTSIAIFEWEWHLYALIFLLGAAFTLKHDKHVRVDVFYSQFSPKGKAWVNLLGTLFWLLPVAYLIAWAGWKFTLNSYAIAESSPDPGGLSMRYLIKAAIPVGFGLLFLQGLAWVIRSIDILTRPSTELPDK
ncbi:MAG: TRAP transporter small permease subunit [Bacteroidota bacterium]